MPASPALSPLPTFSQQAEAALRLLRQREPSASPRSSGASPRSSGASAARAILSPYRICPLGAHVDHQGGPVLGRTVNSGSVLAYAPLAQPEIRLVSEHFGDFRFALGDAVARLHWARYAQAAALALGEHHRLRRGFSACVGGTLVGAGLSSSASVGLAYLAALADVNDIPLTPDELVALDVRLENGHLGLKNGILDPTSIVYGQAGALLHIDTRAEVVQPIPDPPQAAEAVWLAAFSGVSRQLTKSGYNSRVDECRAAAARLAPGAQRLSDVPAEVFAARQADLPGELRRRAAHYFGEVERVRQGRAAWARGELAQFGALMNASCDSSINLYECGSAEIIDLQGMLRGAPGVLGSRFSGGGFGGCVVALVQRGAAEQAAQTVRQAFEAAHPELAARAAIHQLETDAGLRAWGEFS